MHPKDRRPKKIVAVVWLLFSIGFLTGTASIAMAAFGDDLEKPNPEFSTQGDRVEIKTGLEAGATVVVKPEK